MRPRFPPGRSDRHPIIITRRARLGDAPHRGGAPPRRTRPGRSEPDPKGRAPDAIRLVKEPPARTADRHINRRIFMNRSYRPVATRAGRPGGPIAGRSGPVGTIVRVVWPGRRLVALASRGAVGFGPAFGRRGGFVP